MLKSIKRLAIAVTSAGLLSGVAGVAPANAITGGTADGEGHPNVGLILFYEAAGRFRCTGTLVSPTVVLTAAHCTAGTLGKTLVTFDTKIADAPPSGFPVAADPAVGFTDADLAGKLHGQAVAHPEYSDFTDLDNWNDVGVIVLDEPVEGITPAVIAPVDYLNDYAQPVLNQTIFTSVGYGTEVRKPESGKQKPTPQSYPLIRRYADEPGQKLTAQILQVNGNIHDLSLIHI